MIFAIFYFSKTC